MSSANEDRHRVVVIGGGFGGLQATLKVSRARVDVTLVDRRNFHLFQPLAYQVATGALSAGEICYPLRVIFRRRGNVRVLMAEVTGFDLASRRVELAPIGAQSGSSISYDTLIVAGGSQYSYFGHDDWRAAAPAVKSLEGALELRRRILGAFDASLSAKAARSLQRLGVTPRLGETAVAIDDHAVTLQNQGGVVEHIP